ncbi:hypothetical protein WT56_28180 [Burkholderia pseudomultivorans]|uniref:Uncharacterized protein n=1 Tax=Burkholderia pseudomultivorans TaxID=1207504 RepID=A0A132EAK3_9BURK|nr:hypothetical protein WT56_28180 [Burkholderia pseudomultivorans]
MYLRTGLFVSWIGAAVRMGLRRARDCSRIDSGERGWLTQTVDKSVRRQPFLSIRKASSTRGSRSTSMRTGGHEPCSAVSFTRLRGRQRSNHVAPPSIGRSVEDNAFAFLIDHVGAS